MKKMRYKAGDITIIWQPELCTHSGRCLRSLPHVYDPTQRPWIRPENATTEELIEQINACPSGALSYELNEDKE